MKLWTKLFGRKDVNDVNGVNDVIEVNGIRCEHVGGNVYELEGLRYDVDALHGRWKCLQCGEEGMTSRVPSTRTVLENLSGHHLGRHRK